MKSRRKLSKICSIHGKNREISIPYNFWTPAESNVPDVWNWNYWTFFDSEIEVGGWGHGLPSGYAPASIFTTLVYSEVEAYSELCQTSRMEHFVKNSV